VSKSTSHGKKSGKTKTGTHVYTTCCPKVAMRSMEFCVKKAEVQKLMAEYSKHPSGEIDHLEFMQISYVFFSLHQFFFPSLTLSSEKVNCQVSSFF
jgi:hypothetical protein